MNFPELNEKVGRLFRHFRMKHPGQDTIETWLDDLDHIPDEAGEWIVAKICREQDGLPRNIVKAMKDLWRAYQAENPDKVRKREPEFCQVCGTSGLIWFRYQISGHLSPHESFVRCGHCDNHELIGVPPETPRLKAGEIVRRGAVLHWRNNKRRKDTVGRAEKRPNFGRLVKMVEEPRWVKQGAGAPTKSGERQQ